MNDMTVATTSREIIARERAKIIAGVKAKAGQAGQAHGAIVGAHAQQAVFATAHTANKARVAGQAYTTGFVSGFMQGWKG